jgi:hypothetical protein
MRDRDFEHLLRDARSRIVDHRWRRNFKNAGVPFDVYACAVNAWSEYARRRFVAQEAGYGARRE